MNNGYQYSIWCIPENWKEIKRKYAMSHIPHVTIETCLSQIECTSRLKQLNKEYVILFENNIYDFSNIRYKQEEELPAFGFYCKLVSLHLTHRPHMTIKYKCLGKSIKIVESPIDKVKGKVYMVNTISNNPLKWKILK